MYRESIESSLPGRNCLYTHTLSCLTFILLFFINGVITPSSLRAENVIAEYDIPPNSSGLAWDGNLLWMGGVGNNGSWIHAFDLESGEIVDSIRAPVPDCIGLTWYHGRLAYMSPRSDTTYYVDRNGYVVAFANPQGNLAGLGVDGDNFWCATYSERQGTIILMDDEGSEIRSVPYNGSHSRETAFLRGKVYVADRLRQEIRVVNPESGRFGRTFDTPARNPDGLTSDGTYLYLIDDGDENSTDKLYKLLVPFEGSMRFSALTHNFGSVVVEEDKMWSLWIYNDGPYEAELTNFEERDGIENIFIPHLWDAPTPIAAGDSAELRITFQPAFLDSVHIIFRMTYDQGEPYDINLRGKGVGVGRDILIEQRDIDFGVTRCGEHVNGSNLRYLLIENNGGEPFTIEELSFSHESFFHGFYDFPHTFDEPGLYRVPLFFRPTTYNDTSYEESVTIISDDEDQPEINVLLFGLARGSDYEGGYVLWETTVGEPGNPGDRVRAIQDIDDVTGDGYSDVVIASNDYEIKAYHAVATDIAIPIWTYRTNANPWRQGLVAGPRGISEGGDWDGDGVRDIVFGLEGNSRQIIALSGRSGEVIWIFDTHGLPGGGGDIIVTLGEADFNGDGVRDVISAIVNEGEDNTTRGIILLDGTDGGIIWRFDTDESPIDLFSLADFTGDDVNDIITILTDGTVIGIDGSRGQIVWSTEVEGQIMDITATLGDTNGDGSVDLCIVTHASIVMLNGSNGVELWVSRVYDDLTQVIALNDLNGNGSPDIVYTDDNDARAIDGLTAEAAWDTMVFVGQHTGDIAVLGDFDNDGKLDYLVGTIIGRLYAYRGSGVGGLWSYSNIGEGRGFRILKSTRDIDGNGMMDVIGGLQNGRILCLAGTYIGAVSVPIDSENSSLPQMLMVDPAYPNPFNMSVIVPFHLRQSGVLNVAVMNVQGREVYCYRTNNLSAGSHRFTWKGVSSAGSILPSGAYFIELKAGNDRSILPVKLIK